MPAPFAALEQRINAATVEHLANRTFLVDGNPMDGIYLDSYAEIGNIESSNPVFITETRHLEYVEHGTKIETNDGVRYEVVGIKPDGAGMTILELHVEWRI